MPIVICPECSGQVSTTLSSCPHCGFEVPGVVVGKAEAPPPLPKGPRQQSGEEYGGFWIRGLASFIDLFILVIIMLLTMSLLYGEEGRNYQEEFPEPAWEGIFTFWLDWVLVGLGGSSPDFFLGEVLLCGFLFPAIYTIWFNAAKSATPGKMALGLKIVDAKTGKKPSVGRFVGRHFSHWLSYIPFAAGYLWVVWDKRKQGFHDHIVGTVVVKTKKMRPFS